MADIANTATRLTMTVDDSRLLRNAVVQ